MGDIVIPHGLSTLTEALRRRRWWHFVTQTRVMKRTIYKNYGVSWPELLMDYGIRPLVPAVARDLRRRLPGASRRGIRPLWVSVVDPDLARRIHLVERMADPAGRGADVPRTAREEHIRFLSSSLYRRFDVSDRVAAAYGMSAGHPFADPRLAEFCLALPADQKLSDGWTRVVLRRAMADLVPEGVRWRRDKSNLHPLVMSMLFGAKNRGFVADVIMTDTSGVGGYVNLPSVRDAYRRCRAWDDRRGEVSRRELQDARGVWRAVILTLWLEHTGLSA
jgi:asparagine synthase (glutamine-hydrolysing)